MHDCRRPGSIFLSRHRFARLAAALFAAVLSGMAQAQSEGPSFAGIFGDHAVLQRGEPLAIWGKATASQRVSVKLSGNTAEAIAGEDGKWRVSLPAMEAGGPYVLSVSAGSNGTTLKDIMIGDVYLCGGQSNMEFSAGLSTGALSGFEANANLRFANITRTSALSPRDDFKRAVEWKVVSPKTAGAASAVCYYMARSLQRTQKVPVGFISSSWGGTAIQGWISGSSLKSLPAYAEWLDALAEFSSNPAKAIADEARLHEQWWDAHVAGAAAQRGWSAPGFDDSAWSSLRPNGPWKEAGIAEFADFDGVAWFRTTVTLSENQARAANELQLGTIDSFDTTWINGLRVGGGSSAWRWRNYAVPPGVFKSGENVIAVRVLSGGAGGGLSGVPGQRRIKTSDGQFIALAAPWKYKLGARLKGLSMPSAPWEVETGLSTLYNGMIAPLAGYKFKLAAWYQGEANTSAAKEYETLLPLLIADWRKTFAQPELPFLVAQLSSYGPVATKPGPSSWAELRAAQAASVRKDPHAGLAVTIDVGDRTDIHPTQKTVVGERLARAALAVAYGEAITPGGPEAAGVMRSGDDLVVRFRNTGAGLLTYSAAQAIGFEACSVTDCKYALAFAQGDTVTLKGANSPGVTRVRYAWADAPYVNLYNSDDMPAAPFEMDIK